ncbi:MAG: DUF2024 family protein [Bacteroidota bacterium]
MKISVWDTYVTREDGKIMHFDILVPSKMKDTFMLKAYGEQYLSSKDFSTTGFSMAQCNFCHHEISNDKIEAIILERGFSIIEMENCN